MRHSTSWPYATVLGTNAIHMITRERWPLPRVVRSVFARQVGTTFLSKGLILAFSLVTGAITARWLGPEGKGQLTMALLVPGLLTLFLGLGINAANVYFAASERLSIRALSANAASFSILGTFVGFLLIWVLWSSGALELLVPGVPILLVVLGMIALPVGLAISNYSSLLLGLRRITLLNITSLLQSFMYALLLCLFVIWLRKGTVGALVASLGGSLTILMWTVIWARRSGGVVRPRWDKAVARSTVGYGLRAYVGNVLQFFNYRLDILLVNAFLGPSEVGIYGVSVMIAELLWQLPNSVGYVLFPKAAATNSDELNRFTPRVFGLVLGLTALGAGVIALVGKPLIKAVFSASFIGAYVPLLVLLPGVVLIGAGKVLTNDLAGRGYPHYNSIVAGAGLLVTIALDLLLIPRLGITGAALASTAAYSISFLLSALFYRIVVRRTPRL